MRIIINDCEPDEIEAARIAVRHGEQIEAGRLLGVRTSNGTCFSLRRNKKSVSVWIS